MATRAREGGDASRLGIRVHCGVKALTANLRTKTLGFRGFDSSTILILRGGILMSIGFFLESLSQAILVGIILVGRLGVKVTGGIGSVSQSSTFRPTAPTFVGARQRWS